METYYQRTKKRRREYMREYYHSHKEQEVARRKAWRDKVREEKGVDWTRNQWREYQRKSRARKKKHLHAGD